MHGSKNIKVIVRSLALNMYLQSKNIKPKQIKGDYKWLDISNGYSSQKDHSKIRNDFCIQRSNYDKIPKQLHLTCKNKNNITNSTWRYCIQQYKQLYTDYTINLYDNNDIYTLIGKHYPQYLQKIKQIKIGAVLADIFRYLKLYLEGGIYSDMDCEPLKKVDDLLNDKIFYHGNKNNNFYIYPKTKKRRDKRWDFYHNICSNCELLSNNSN